MRSRASGERTSSVSRVFCGRTATPRWAGADQTIDARCSMDGSALLNGCTRVRQWIARCDSMDRTTRLNGWDKTFQWIDDHPSISRGILAGATRWERWCDSLLSHQRQRRLAGAIGCSHWCDYGNSQVRLRYLADATSIRRRRARKPTIFEKIAHNDRVAADARTPYLYTQPFPTFREKWEAVITQTGLR